MTYKISYLQNFNRQLFPSSRSPTAPWLKVAENRFSANLGHYLDSLSVGDAGRFVVSLGGIKMERHLKGELSWRNS